MATLTSTAPAPKTDWVHILIGGAGVVAGVAIPAAIAYAQNLPWATIWPAFGTAIPPLLNVIRELVTTQSASK